MTPKIKIIGKGLDSVDVRKIEEQAVVDNVSTVYNIHMPGKGSLSVKHYRETGKLKKDR